MTPTLQCHIRSAVRLALAEDLGSSDATTTALLPKPLPARARIIAKQPCTVAGIAVARAVLADVDARIRISRAVADGTAVSAGALLLEATGDGRSLLAGERVALNFLQRLSGIATLTARYCHAVRGYRARIVDTRKTSPGLRVLEKWAVRLGGGANHRFNLSDGILIKDNHLAMLKAGGVGIEEACRRAREQAPHGLRIIVETQTLGEVREALNGGADVILLDNMSLADVRAALASIKGRAVAEASGGITPEAARDLAAAGVDIISVGALTHSAPAIDLSLDLQPLRRRTAPS
jgi:nicotinate-nucleotide pyrophosphorylase (carboxylating)